MDTLNPKYQVNARFEEAEYRQLVEIARASDRSIGYVVRDMVRRELARMEAD